ncbi:MAG: ectoine/hydroxyectoine ABC transporter permease subunit EhuD [Alicyclobacillus macrosporangiidus]|uniref:ectoine/hydroxyectoine ABC transporter permease subunit EhuD n=1 Tax=Alicyclobacillus macrosporangiidus TaxID=392015 RepID=UPI0026EAE640|nr:ectoine/hydroxyectoine ABC transporter permease subunit EhuD [Alicyclobacillus macrosporangiidus]MCL6599672.1 ectoine/hydroxyectoine ABC transporter permease subunit EhuD [Alicyclobacillus macrosporangiidus]
MWSWSFAIQVFPQLLSAFRLTIEVTVVAFLLACVLGLAFECLRRSRVKPLRWAEIAVTEFIRTTPPLVQLYFIFYVLPLYGWTLSPFWAGVIGLGVHYATYMAEVYRAGIDAVPKAQWEAATALNFSRTQTWVRIVFPQAIPPMIPVFGNYLLDLLKMTPLLSAITVVEVLQEANIIGSNFFRYTEPYTIAGVLFLVVSYLGAIVFRKVEVRMQRRYHLHIPSGPAAGSKRGWLRRIMGSVEPRQRDTLA